MTNTNKSILVISTPNNCGECPICASYAESAFSYREYWCPPMDNRDVNPESKPDWCPLRTAPEYAEIWHDDARGDWERGYNNCLREIIGK